MWDISNAVITGVFQSRRSGTGGLMRLLIKTKERKAVYSIIAAYNNRGDRTANQIVRNSKKRELQGEITVIITPGNGKGRKSFAPIFILRSRLGWSTKITQSGTICTTNILSNKQTRVISVSKTCNVRENLKWDDVIGWNAWKAVISWKQYPLQCHLLVCTFQT